MAIDDYLTEFAERDWQEIDEGTLRIAMIGLGWWTRDQAIPAVEKSDFCETTVVVSGGREKAERVRDGTESITTALTYDEFIDGAATDDYDAVYVCTPNALHEEYVAAAAEYDKAVLCEKPLEATVERAESLVDAAADIPLMVAYRMQTDPAVRRMRELIRDGVIGEPVAVHGHMTQRMIGLASEDASHWRLDPDLVGYGASVTDLGIYPINTARFVLDADPVSATATMQSDSEAFDDVPDEHASFTVTFDDGTAAACTASQNSHLSGSFRVIGTEGEARIEPIFHGRAPQTLTLSRSSERSVTVDDGRRDVMNDEMTEEFDYFADRVLRGVDPEPDGEHGLVDMYALEAVYEAAESGRTVTID